MSCLSSPVPFLAFHHALAAPPRAGGGDDVAPPAHRAFANGGRQDPRLEQAFEQKSRKLKAEMDAAGRELAEVVRKGDADSPEIDAALVRLNTAQTELQGVMLEHFFAMKEHLDPEQAEKLLEWTHDSIVHE